MPEGQVFTGTAVGLRDALVPHPLGFVADEAGGALRTLAPGSFAGGGGAPGTFCKFASVILGALARLPLAGGPTAGRVLDTRRCTSVLLRRGWSTALAVVRRMNWSNELVVGSQAQCGPFVGRLAALRKSATAAGLDAFNLTDAALRLVGVDPAASVQPESTGRPMGWLDSERQLGGLAAEGRGTLEVAARCEIERVWPLGALALALALLALASLVLIYRRAMPPHIFKLAARAFSELQLDHRPQTVLVLGESGAGKTETTEAVLEIL